MIDVKRACDVKDLTANAFFCPLVMFGSWFDHIKSWLNADDKQSIMYISYEEMIMVRPKCFFETSLIRRYSHTVGLTV